MRLAIIPARGGSKRIPRKNLIRLAGIPLVAHSIRHAHDSRHVDQVVVSTDDDAIAEVATAEGAEVVRRPAALSDDRASSESALIHVLDTRHEAGRPDPDLIVFLQCTSPVRADGDIDRAIETLEREGADSALSVCETKRFIWKPGADGPAPVNYDFRARKREQDADPQYQENGSIYLCKPWVLRQQNNRLGGRIVLYEMDYWSSFQIDTPEDLELCEWILRQRRPAAIPWPAELRLVVFDFDGVMTDGRVIVHQNGESVVCSRRDGLGVEALRRAGVPALVLSKETNPVVTARADKLRIPCVQGIDDKAAFLRRYLDEHGIPAPFVAYVGDDVNDIECLRMVGLPVAVQDAHPTARREAALVLNARGGLGAVREFCDLVLEHVVKRGERVDATSR